MKKRRSKREPEVRSISTDGTGSYTGSFALPTHSGTTVTPQTALRIAAVWNAVNIYANAVASLDLHVYERSPKGGKYPAYELPLYDVVSMKPNRVMSSFRWRQAGTGHLMTHGNWYSEIERDRYGIPVALHLLDPKNVKPYFDERKQLRYELIREKASIPAADMLHFAGLGWDGIQGYSPISFNRETLGLAEAEQTYSASTFGNNANIRGHLEFPGKLNEVAKDRLTDTWNKKHQGAQRAGNLAILDNGLKWVMENFSPADAELILSRSFSIAEIARIFNIPQNMLGLMDKAAFSNIEEQNRQFYVLSLLPWLINLRQELNIKLLSRPDRRAYEIDFDARGFLRGNTAARMSYYTSMFKLGTYSPNQVLIEEGLNPLDHPNADKHYLEANNLVALEDMDDGKVEPAAQLDPAPEEESPDEPDPNADPDEADTDDGKAVDAVRELLLDTIGRMIRQECESARRASKRPRFDLWAEEFYPKHRAKVASAIAPAIRTARLLSLTHRDHERIASSIKEASVERFLGLAKSIEPDDLPSAVDRACKEWEASRASSIVDAILGAKS